MTTETPTETHAETNIGREPEYGDAPPVYFEDLTRGRTLVSPEIDITMAHLKLFNDLTLNSSRIHREIDLAKKVGFTNRVLPGALVVGVMLPLHGAIAEQRTVGLLGLNDVRFLVPVYVGDRLRLESTVISVRGTSKADRGMVTFQERIVGSEGRDRIHAQRIALYQRRNPTA
ncbi:MaoC family dehydratase [Actinophytocola sp.]|uniref:MaoC family dehydratase n=1 Tax=Actinophytocola sp. TaxID=1872138 RepID=UPI003D6BA327